MMGELRDLNILKDQNLFLHDVYDDYKKYHDHFIKQKTDYMFELQEIIRYLEKNMYEAGLTDRALRQAKFEQKRLLGKLGRIKSEIDESIGKF